MSINYNNSKFISNTLVSRHNRLCPAGTVQSFAGLNPPSGWLLCDGTAVSRTTYPVLFAAIGIIYGAGDGATTFNLPDMRGKVSVAAGQGTIGGVPLSVRNIGSVGGEENHTLTLNEIPAHTHTYDKSNAVQNINAPDAAGITAANETTTAVNSGSAGGGAAHNVMQPFLVLNHIIKF
jgi:microcystin-dependent protein